MYLPNFSRSLPSLPPVRREEQIAKAVHSTGVPLNLVRFGAPFSFCRCNVRPGGPVDGFPW